MKVAIIAPIKFLRKYCITKFYLCYADIALWSTDYLNFYRERAKTDFVILDHSPKIPRKPLLNSVYLEAIREIAPGAVVLPNIDYSCTKTLSLSTEFYERYIPLGGKGPYPKLIGVAQGTDLKEIKKCISGFKNMVDLIGLPSSCERFIPRYRLLPLISRPIIYLEVYSDPYKEVLGNKLVVGICTSLPLRLAYDLRRLIEFIPTPKPLDFYKETEPLPELAKENVGEYLDLIGETE